VIGKTTVVYAVANDLGYDVIEMNASDARTESEIKKKLGESISSTNLMAFMKSPEEMKRRRRKKIIFIDEVDGISGRSDRGGLSTLLDMLKKTKIPIIMASNFYNSKFRTLYNNTNKIKCNGLKKPSIMNLLKRIVREEDLEIDSKTIEIIADNSCGDLRSAINDLQAIAQGHLDLQEGNIEEFDMHRDVQEKMYSFIKTMFQTKTVKGAKNVVDSADIDYNLLHQVVYSNLENFVTDSLDMTNALMNIAQADVIMGRIRKQMDFSTLPYYFDLISGGVVLSVDYPNLFGYKKFKFHRFLGGRSKFMDDPLADEIQEEFLISKRDILLDILPYMKDLIESYPRSEKRKFTEELAEEFGLTDRELNKYL
ncbi:MAG: AAA family ATPase, partial [Candidatus Lokiarchaeota archaeon]|nr:AAA family ATPase [Candidatus Lokiarchaeota archaeon]